ncbi:MAG: C40 family peptidase [Deltaproteobacteria bacterium]|nr:C40 family peptidase [Deltaproteobacteria bacterium]
MNGIVITLAIQAALAWSLDHPIENLDQLKCVTQTQQVDDPLYELKLNQGTRHWVGLLWRPDTLRLTPRSRAPSADTLLDTARGFLGTPYVWGGVGRRGLDCSGFVNAVYARHGYDLPRVSRDQFRVGVKTPRSRLAPGDLLFFVTQPGTKKITHVGMYVGDNEFIHAARGKGKVTYDRLTSRYYSARFAGARRFLSLKPGRFSDKIGRYRKGRLYGSAKAGGVDPVLLELGLADPSMGEPDVLDSIGLSESGDTLREHAGEQKPMQLSSGFIKGTITGVGPSLVATEETSIGVRLGGGHMAGSYAFVIAPEFTYFGHDNALALNIGVPLHIPVANYEGTFSEVFKAGWDKPRDYTKLIRGIKFGQKESNLYVELSRTLSGSLGHGQLMRFFTPNVGSAFLPEYTLEADALSLAFDGYLGFGGFELFIDDLIVPRVFGGLFFLRPSVLAGTDNALLKRLSLALTYAGDVGAPMADTAVAQESFGSVHGIGFDAEFKFYKSGSLDMKAYADVSGLLYTGGSSAGGALGLLVRSNIESTSTHILRGRLEFRISEPSFIPSYFDTTYKLGRLAAPSDTMQDTAPETKLDLLNELESDPSRWGFYTELTYHLFRRFSVMASYEDSGTFGDALQTYSGRNFMVTARVQDVYWPKTTKTMDFYLAYHLRNIDSAKGLFTLDKRNEFIFAAASMRVSRFVEVSATVRKGVNESDPYSRGALDAMLGLAFRYEL